jgi:tetratricopeptide (TPR) repeat protein
MNANTPWLAAHGRLWYDNHWYRAAWIIWPQTVGLLLFVVLWLNYPAAQGVIPWARPVLEAAKNPNITPQVQQPSTIPPSQQQVAPQPQADNLAPCKGNDWEAIIPACTGQLTSGRLRGDEVAWAYLYRGSAYYHTKQYQLALNDFDRAITMNGRVPDFYNERGRLWVAVQKYEVALQNFNQAILLKPDYAIPYFNRGIALNDLNRPNEAFLAFNKSVELDPNDFDSYYQRASILDDRSNWRGVYDDANKMIQLQPDNRLGYEFRGHAYIQVGQNQAAINDFTKAISIDASIFAHRMRGRAYFLMDQYDSAMADYQAALQIDPKDSRTMDYINELKRKMRNR